MSRFSNANNRNLFLKKKKSISNAIVNEEVKEIEEEIKISVEEDRISTEEVIYVPPVIETIDEPIIESVNEPIIRIEDIYKENAIVKQEDVITPVENPQQIELKKRKSKEKFKLLVNQILLNKKKEIIDGWTV